MINLKRKLLLSLASKSSTMGSNTGTESNVVHKAMFPLGEAFFLCI